MAQVKPNQQSNMQRNIIILLATLVAVLTIWVIVLIGGDKKHNPTSSPANQASHQPLTVEGEAVCLPHKDTSGPQTQECAYGVKTADGTYYQLETSDIDMMSSLITGTQVRVKGTFQEKESQYQSKGVITLESVEEL